MRRLAPLLRAPLCALLLTLAGCGGPTEVVGSVAIGEPFELRLGETVVVRDRQFSLVVLAVLEDSRCPTDALVVCVREGRVRLRLATAPLTGDQAFHEIHLGDEPNVVTLGDLRLRLLEVRPAARLDRIPDGEYRARFELTVAP